MSRAFRGLVRKEFIQVFRDRNMLRIIFARPIIQLLLFGYVVNLEVKNIRRAEDPLFSVAKGCLVASLSDV